MLTQLITLLENKNNGLSLAEMSRALHAQPSALVPMLKLLVRKGKLAEIGPDEKYCKDCGLQSGCNLLAIHSKRYVCISCHNPGEAQNLQ